MKSVYKTVRLDVNLPAEFQIQSNELTSLAKYLNLCESYNRNLGAENNLSLGR